VGKVSAESDARADGIFLLPLISDVNESGCERWKKREGC